MKKFVVICALMLTLAMAVDADARCRRCRRCRGCSTTCAPAPACTDCTK